MSGFLQLYALHSDTCTSDVQKPGHYFRIKISETGFSRKGTKREGKSVWVKFNIGRIVLNSIMLRELRREIEIQQEGVLMADNVIVKWGGGEGAVIQHHPSVSVAFS